MSEGQMKYYIAVEIEAMGPIADLTAALQRAFDGGTAGDFQVLVTRAPTYMVIFERSVSEDGEYVSKRTDSSAVSIELAAMHQLAAELIEGDIGAVAQPVVEDLQNGDCQCFDYGVGAFAAMAEYTSEDGKHKIKVSLDGGLTFQEATEGVRVVYEGVDIPGDDEDGTGELHVTVSHEGLVTDVWSTLHEPLDYNIGTSSVLIDDLVSDLTKRA